MTRSALSENSPRVVRKAFRAQAKSQGQSFRAAILAQKARAAEDGKKVEYPDAGRRNPGRMDGMRWNGDSFVSPPQVDGEEVSSDLEDDGASEWAAGVADGKRAEGSLPQPMVVSLLDIARPAKPRGGKKHRAVNVVEDDAVSVYAESELWEEWDAHSEGWEVQSELWEIPEGEYTADEWEELYEGNAHPPDKPIATPRLSYASALRR
ncbi:unnamed protein product [Mycena citricolor]|uniref:Uncharacterized protein n=1 Tax=Mycena citricolor TaxID=2018698 RepID=A0AAD2I227_9AGAR|nr:unnamed protein product [Mycena citricolor]